MFGLRLTKLNLSLAVLAGLAVVYAGVPSGPSKTYYFKYFSTSGSISTFYNNDNSWGVNSPSGTGFVVMVDGEDWGTTSPVTTLPKQLSKISSKHHTQFTQTASPASGSGYDACYDIFIDPQPGPTNRNSINEIMIWVGHRLPNSPLSNSYNASGQAVPHETNVSLAGKAWDVYLYNWSGGGYTMSYVDRANSGSFSGQLTDFFNHGISKGWYTSSQYLNSVMAGWEFGHGTYTAHSFSATGF